MKIVYMGTPDFAAFILEALLQSRHEIAAVVTQPDRQKGRGKAVVYPPVKEKALQYGIPVYQPLRARDPEFIRLLQTIHPDCIVVAAFGQILPKEILTIPMYGCINVHASLLPAYRGAAPIQWCIIDGQKETGITIMQMDEGIDTGDMLNQFVIPLEEKETGESLFDKMARAGGPLLLETLEQAEAGTLCPKKQEEEKASYAKMLTKEHGNICWERPAEEIERLIRGLNSWPSAYSFYKTKTLKIWQADVIDEDSDQKPGQIVSVSDGNICVQTGRGILRLTEVQLEGKKRMKAAAFLNGCHMEAGEMLTPVLQRLGQKATEKR